MVSLRPKLVVQTQSAEPDSRALFGLFSVNNALQMYNFLDMATIRRELSRLETIRPGEDHGCPRNGGYSIFALHRGLQQKGFRLLHLNRMGLLQGRAKGEWARRLCDSKFKRLLIIGKPAGQLENIYHCIASAHHAGKCYINDPDESRRAEMTESTLRAFLPTLSSVYAVVTLDEHAKYHEMFRRAKDKAQRIVEHAKTRRDQKAIQKALFAAEPKRARGVRRHRKA